MEFNLEHLDPDFTTAIAGELLKKTITKIGIIFLDKGFIYIFYQIRSMRLTNLQAKGPKHLTPALF